MDRDYELVRRWFDHRDERAATELVETIEPFLRETAFYYTLDHQAIDEVVPLILSRLLALDQYAPGRATFRTYAATCVRNGLFTYFRGQKRRPPMVPIWSGLGDDDDEARTVDPADPTANPLDLLDRADADAARRLLGAATNAVPDPHRIPLALHDLGCTYARIAGMLGVPKGTIRSRISRGRDARRMILLDSRDPALRDLVVG